MPKESTRALCAHSMENLICSRIPSLVRKERSKKYDMEWWLVCAGITLRKHIANVMGLWWLYLGCFMTLSLQWHHSGRNGVSNHQPYDCLLKRLFKCRSKKASKRHVIGFCAGNSPVTGEFPTQMPSNAKKFSIWWRHHVLASVGSIWRHLITVVYAFFKFYTSLVKPEGGVLFLYIWTDFWLWLTATDKHSIRPSMENA